MKLLKALKRDRKIHKRKYGMKIDGKSIFDIVGIQVKKSNNKKKGGLKNDQ